MRYGVIPPPPLLIGSHRIQHQRVSQRNDQSNDIDDTNFTDRMALPQVIDEQAMIGLEQELRWVHHGLPGSDPRLFEGMSRRARKTLMEFDGWLARLATEGIGPARPRIPQGDLALIQGIRSVQHLLDIPGVKSRILEIQGDDINIQTHVAVNPQWRTEPMWHWTQSGMNICSHQCEQQNCRSAINCERQCSFSHNHKIPHLCSIHWGCIINEFDADAGRCTRTQAFDESASDDSSNFGAQLTVEAIGTACHLCSSFPSPFVCATCRRRACTDCCATVSPTPDVELPECDACAEVRRSTLQPAIRGPVRPRSRWIEDF